MKKFTDEYPVETCNRCPLFEYSQDGRNCTHPHWQDEANWDTQSGAYTSLVILDIDTSSGIPVRCPLRAGEVAITKIVYLSPSHKVLEKNEPIVLKEILIKKANVRDHMNRIFSINALKTVVEKYDETGRVLLGSITPQTSSSIDISTVSHAIEKIYMKDDCLYADIRVLDTSEGS